MTIFPILQPRAQEAQEIPVCQDVGWNYSENRPLWRNGSPVMVQENDAILSWAYRALQTPRFRYDIYTWAYGNECESLIGGEYTEELKQAEAARYVRECLEVNPYISAVRDITVDFEAGCLTISCRIESIYGVVKVNVRTII